jgi:hypothetical protein
MKHQWLERTAIATPYLTLVLNQEQYHAALDDLKYKGERPRWVSPGAGATTHHLQNDDGSTACIVALDDSGDQDPIATAGLLVHEAVHVWQELVSDMNEQDPSREFEAYAIQSISQQLMWEYVRQRKEKSE